MYAGSHDHEFPAKLQGSNSIGPGNACNEHNEHDERDGHDGHEGHSKSEGEGKGSLPGLDTNVRTVLAHAHLLLSGLFPSFIRTDML